MRASLFSAIIIAVLWVGSSEAFADPAAPGASAPPDCRSGVLHPEFSLRADFTDLGPFVCPLQYFTAQGASVSAVYNAQTPQTGLAIDGLATYAWRYYVDLHPNDHMVHLIGYAFGPYVQGDGLYQLLQLTTPPRGTDTVTSGAFAQLAFTSPFIDFGEDTFRFRGAQADASTGTYSTTFVAEWIPYFGTLGPFSNEGEVPNLPFDYRFFPELMVQYDHFEGGPNKYQLFAINSEALRIGPEAAVHIYPSRALLIPYVGMRLADFLSNVTVQATYHDDWDAYTGRNFSMVAVSAVYTFPQQHFGISASYGHGNSEVTGNLTNQVKMGFAAKF